MSDAEATVQRHAKVMQEIRDRRTDFAQIVVNAASMSQLKTGNNITNATSRFTYLEFQGRTLRDLEDEEIQLGYKLNIGSTPALDLHLEFGRERLHADDKSADAIWEMIEKQDISSAPNKDLPALQAAAQKELGWIFRGMMPMGRGVPACGFGVVASRLLTGYPSYIAQFEPWFSR